MTVKYSRNKGGPITPTNRPLPRIADSLQVASNMVQVKRVVIVSVLRARIRAVLLKERRP